MTTVALAAIALGSPFPFAQGVYSMSSMPFVVVHAATVKGPALFKVDASGSVHARAEMLANFVRPRFVLNLVASSGRVLYDEHKAAAGHLTASATRKCQGCLLRVVM